MKESIDLIKNNKSVALLAPSFPIDFKYPAIIGMLRHLGFDEVTELTFGARMVNWSYANYIKDHPEQEFFIASPCPTVVLMVKTQFPEFAEFLIPTVSPMAATAKIYKSRRPDCKVIFIAPCYAKEKIEAPKYKEFIDGVITFKELREIFDAEGIKEDDFNKDYYFDSFIREYTKIYPVSGGLASTSHIGGLFKEGETFVTDGPDNIKEALEDIKAGRRKYRFLDLLNCPGGCIGGPAMAGVALATGKKKEIIFEYTSKSSEHTMGRHEGKVHDAEEVDLKAVF